LRRFTEEGTSRQREGFQALLVKAAAAMEAAGGELTAAEAGVYTRPRFS